MRRSLVLLGVAGALFTACSLDVVGLGGAGSTAQGGAAQGGGAQGGGSSHGAGGMGGSASSTDGAGGGGGGITGPDPTICIGTPVTVTTAGTTIPTTLTGMTDQVAPGCGPVGKADVIYAVTPAVTGTLTATVSSQGGFSKSLSLRAVCANQVPLSELSCVTNGDAMDLTQTMWVTAGKAVYVIVDGDAHDFTLKLDLSQCGDGKVQGLEECDDAAKCPGCVACSSPDEIWDSVKQRCYRLVPTHETWVNARAKCVAWGGDLAGVSTPEELDFLMKSQTLGKLHEDIWTSGYALRPLCAYVWADSEPWWNGGWAPNEPNNAGDERCAALSYAGGHTLNDANCGGQLAYLCERAPAGTCGDGAIQAGEECDDLSAPLGTCKDCRVRCAPDEFKDPFTHHCYKLVTGANAASWDDAKSLCGQYAGHLAVISSAEENTLIRQHIEASTWIGGRWSVPDGSSWEDKEPFCFDNWDSGQPDLFWEHCLEIYRDGTWNNLTCSNTRDFVCEREP